MQASISLLLTGCSVSKPPQAPATCLPRHCVLDLWAQINPGLIYKVTPCPGFCHSEKLLMSLQSTNSPETMFSAPLDSLIVQILNRLVWRPWVRLRFYLTPWFWLQAARSISWNSFHGIFLVFPLHFFFLGGKLIMILFDMFFLPFMFLLWEPFLSQGTLFNIFPSLAFCSHVKEKQEGLVGNSALCVQGLEHIPIIDTYV